MMELMTQDKQTQQHKIIKKIIKEGRIINVKVIMD